MPCLHAIIQNANIYSLSSKYRATFKKHILQLLGIFFNTTLNNATSSLGSSYAIFTWGTRTLIYFKVKQSLKHMQTQPSFHFITFLLLSSNELKFFQKKSSKVLHFLWNIRSKMLHYLVVETGIFNILCNSVSCSLAHYDIIAF